jgi:hypothetical protein
MRLVGLSSNLNGDFTLKQNQYANLMLDIGNGKMTPYVTIVLKKMKTQASNF